MQFARNLSRYENLKFSYGSIQDFQAAEFRNGIHSISYGKGNLDVLVENRDSAVTLVMFHAAMPKKGLEYPVFAGRKLVKELPTNLIFVSDPIMELGVNLGWFAGDKRRVLQADLVTVLQDIIGKQPREQRMIFFGPSGGGFAALYFSHKFPGSLAIPVNPQTNISRYGQTAVDAYLDVAWRGESLEKTGIDFDLTKQYGQDFPNYVLYLQNLGDAHVEKHLLPFLKAVSGQPERFALLMEDWGKGHRPPPWALLKSVLFEAVKADSWQSLLSALEIQTAPDPSSIRVQRNVYQAP